MRWRRFHFFWNSKILCNYTNSFMQSTYKSIKVGNICNENSYKIVLKAWNTNKNSIKTRLLQYYGFKSYLYLFNTTQSDTLIHAEQYLIPRALQLISVLQIRFVLGLLKHIILTLFFCPFRRLRNMFHHPV